MCMMGGITKTIVRFGVIAGLAAGGAALIAGPQRVAALADQARTHVVDKIDAQIGDPTAMRHQLRELEAQYPKRIAEVRGQLAEIAEQTRQLERDRAVSSRVVELAMNDRAELDDLIARAESAVAERGSARLVRIAFDDRTLDLDGAYARANTINETIHLYTSRADNIEADLEALESDREILTGLLGKLETEQAEFQSQIAQLDAKIDAIARKERMADLMERRQKRINELTRYEVASLDQLRSKLAERHAELDARIAGASSRDDQSSYEDRARFEVDSKRSRELRIETPAASRTIVGPNDEGEAASDDEVKTIARR
jgi:chromosome segregation ATPase